ncbi:hypothetical protein [Microbispora sp. NPDC049125]|uniref:hypothetical protein n=1 Tax=Microbispora sp. NPDC049125 TaxID=3154929 RepID=UPI0034662B44
MDNQNNSDKDNHITTIIVAIISGLFLVISAYVGADANKSEEKGSVATPAAPAPSPSSVTPRSSAGSPSPVPGIPVDLSAVPAGHRTVTVTAAIRRPARTGYSYWFVLEVQKVSNTHSEFYPRQKVTGEISFEIDIPYDADISRPRTGQVFEVPDEIGDRLESGHPDPGNPSADFLFTPPCTCAVSREIALAFKD